MPNKNLTDAEIKKALKTKREDMVCAVVDKNNNTHFITNQVVLDLINRQEEEIERLKKEKADILAAFIWEQMELEEFKLQVIKMCAPREDEPAEYTAERVKHLEERVKRNANRIKAEAYKEFAERLCAITKAIPEMKAYFIRENDLDNLLKEMEGELNER